MVYVENPFGTDIAEIQEMNSGNRIGRRIRRVREESDPAMSQSDLGAKVGLNANRVQQYENGARTPRLDLLKKFAEALGVQTAALNDPDPSTYIGVMYALFEMEAVFGLEPVEMEDGQIYLTFGKNRQLSENLRSWYDVRQKLAVALQTATTAEDKKKATHEYHMWEWTFPKGLVEDSEARRKQILRKQIEELQAKLDEMKED